MGSENLALQIRKDAIEMTHISNGSHIGAVLSIADIMAVLYEDILHYDCKHPDSQQRDRFVLSKGHAGAAVYSVLANKGFFPREILKTHYANGSLLSAHVSHKVAGIDFSTGALGHGICVAAGMALSAMRKKETYHVYAVMGDGECDEGSTWEMALFAHQFKLDNLTIIVDHNKMQALGRCEEVLSLESLKEKWEAFGWHVIEIDGHDHTQLRMAIGHHENHKPVCVIANTVKGKGISFMENQLAWHYKSPMGEDYERAIQELEKVNA